MNQSFRNQTTLGKPISVQGWGYWSGRDICLTFRPAKADAGVTFVRTDLPGSPRIPAVIQNRVNGPRRTTLVANGAPVEMVEHVLAALAGMQIDNCEVHVDRAEMPGFDGSSFDFVSALLEADRVELNRPRLARKIRGPLRVGDQDSWIQAEPADCFEIEYNLSYDCPAIGSQQFAAVITPEFFASEIAPARTFVLRHEAEQLQKQGLGQRVTYRDLLVFDDQGPIENELRFDNECARHKLLDVVGDFALSGFDILGKFKAYRSGHRLNSRMVFAILQQAVNSDPHAGSDGQKIRIPA
ncbi:MAG: UDP-3-O-acyl-N-acetylglucosamine deacetylase [Planctomycetota bacterium]